MRNAFRLLPVLAGVFLGGCASQASLTVFTEPAGGYVSQQGGASIGTAPVKISYDPGQLKNYTDSSGCFLVRGVSARWVSGAVTNTEQSIRLCGAVNGSYTYTVTRDANYPDLQSDLQFAAQLSGAAAQRAQANAASVSAAAALLQAARPSPFQPMGSGVTGFFKREYTSGFNKICIYDKLGSEYAVTVAATALCPMTAP